MSLTILCQRCNRAAATTNFEISPNMLMAVCAVCAEKINQAMELERVTYRAGSPQSENANGK